jgi:hypothetical protein
MITRDTIPDLPGALCVGAPVDLWHATRAADITAAKAVCARCPASDRCLAWAVARDEPAGVWGGLTRDERVADNEPAEPAKLAAVVAAAKPRAPRPRPTGPTRDICGTDDGRQAHRGRRERFCDACKAAGLAECGTRGGRSKHLRKGEPVCDRCARAEAEYQERRRHRARIGADR